MRVLVTGGTGFLGRALAKRLLQEGLEVTLSGRNPQKATDLVSLGARFVAASLEDAAAVQRLCYQQQIVFHCGALSSPWGPTAAFMASNWQGTRYVVQACLQNQVERLVHVSTPSIYVGYNSQLNVSENHPLPPPINAYAHSKALAETEVQKGLSQGLPSVILRPRAIYGPEDSAILPRIVRALKRGRLPIVGDGQNLTDLTYIDDAVQALWLAAQAPQHAVGQAYNITSGDPQPLWPLLFDLCDALGFAKPRRQLGAKTALALAGVLEVLYRYSSGREPPLTRYAVSVLSSSVTLNIQAARRDLGYQPQVNSREGLQRYVQWWRQHAA